MTEETPQKPEEQPEEEPQDYKALLQRVQADFTNYKRRIESERQGQAQLAGSLLVTKMLPIIDDLERALEAVPEEIAESDWVKGMALLRGKLMSILEKEGLSRVPAEDMQFDPLEHEAITVEEVEGVSQGRVLAVHQEGYRFNGRLLRPAQVSVAK